MNLTSKQHKTRPNTSRDGYVNSGTHRGPSGCPKTGRRERSDLEYGAVSRAVHPVRVDVMRTSTCAIKHLSKLRPPPSLNSRLWDIKRRLKLLDDVSAVIEAQRLALQREHARAHNALQPILRLPPEILTSVFETGLPDVQCAWSDNPILQSTHSPTLEFNKQFLVVNAVCKRFRSVALHSPLCWTKIVLRVVDGKPMTPTPLLATILQRSTDCKFDLVLALSLQHTGVLALRAVLEGLRSHMRCCRSIVLSSTYPDFHMAETTRVLQDIIPAPALQHLVFMSFPGPRTVMNVQGQEELIVPFLTGVEPSLLSLAIELHPHSLDGHTWRTSSLNGLTFGQLKRLRLDVELEGAWVIEVLRHCPSLEHLYWAGTMGGGEEDEHELKLTHLLSINLRRQTPVDMFPPLCAPALVQVVIADYEATEMERHFMFREDQPPLPSMRRLSFPPLCLEPETLRSTFALCPALDELALTLTVDDIIECQELSDIIDCLLLCSENGVPAVVPGLRVLWLETDSAHWMPADNIFLLESIRRLLINRRDTKIRLSISTDPEYDKHLDLTAITALSKEFSPRLPVTFNHNLDTNWPEAWSHTCF